MAMQGRKALLEKLAKIQGAPRQAMRAALARAGGEIVAQQKALAPKNSGALERSIGMTFGDFKAANANVRGFGDARAGDPDLSLTIHAGDATAFYAAFVEFGTNPHYVTKGGGTRTGIVSAKLKRAKQHPGATPHPFFYPPYRANRKRAKSAIARAAGKAIREASK